MTRLNNLERTNVFGSACDTSHQTTYTTPWGLSVRVHKAILERLDAACRDASQSSGWEPRRIDSYACRDIRGSTQTSLHSWALAWDLFATDPGVPPPGGVWKPDATFGEDFARPFLVRGFTWGRYFDRQDWPHLEWGQGLPKGGGFVYLTEQEERDLLTKVTAVNSVLGQLREPLSRFLSWVNQPGGLKTKMEVLGRIKDGAPGQVGAWSLRLWKAASKTLGQPE